MFGPIRPQVFGSRIPPRPSTLSETDAPGPQSGGPTGTATLSKELGDFLIELSIGVHRYAMYPPGHPSLEPAVRGIVRRLGPLLANRSSLNIGVARRQLVIEGVATQEKHPVLSEMARRLHELQLGAVSFQVGATGAEISDLLTTLSQEVDPHGTPLGLRPSKELPTWPHIRIHPLGYERLAIKAQEGQGPPADRSTQLWLGLARAALGKEEVDPEEAGSAELLARSVEERKQDAAYDQVIVGYMLQLANELKSEKTQEAERIRRRMATLVREMDDDTLTRLVDMGGNFAQRKRFVLDANESLSVDAVVKVLRSAASASGETVSTSMTRLLSKLATHADEGPSRLRMQAGSALHDNVERLLDGWALEDPNPDEYTRTLDTIARAAPIFQAGERRADLIDSDDDEMPGALRLLETALEVDSYGPTVETAVLDLVGMGYVGTVLSLVRDLADEQETARVVLEEVTDPTQIRRFLARHDVDEPGLIALSEVLGDRSIPFFLDALADSESRAVRRKVFDRLGAMGSAVGSEVVARLAGEPRWYVVRNWLALLHFFPESAVGVDVLTYLRDAEPRVRREALPLALNRPDVRDRALAMALADPDERNCRLAVTELPTPLPDVLVPSVVKRVLRARRDPALKRLAIRALQGSRSALVRDVLLEAVVVGRSILGKAKLAEPNPIMVAALQVLARDWADDPEVAPVLDLARRSRQDEVRDAASGGNV
jgi:hypothetical protein